MNFAMSRRDREAFLAEPRVGVVSVADGDRGPITVPIWYAYEPGGVLRFTTGGHTRKAECLRRAGRASLCVQADAWPYRYVSVEGRIEIGKPDFERDVAAIARRYFGDERAKKYLEASAEERGKEIVVTLVPERWFSIDYSGWPL